MRKLTDYGLGLYATPAYCARHGTPAEAEALRRHLLVTSVQELLHYSESLTYYPPAFDAGSGASNAPACSPRWRR